METRGSGVQGLLGLYRVQSQPLSWDPVSRNHKKKKILGRAKINVRCEQLGCPLDGAQESYFYVISFSF